MGLCFRICIFCIFCCGYASCIEAGLIPVDSLLGTDRLIRYVLLKDYSIVSNNDKFSNSICEDICKIHGIFDASCKEDVCRKLRSYFDKVVVSDSPSGVSDFMFRDSKYSIRSYNNSVMEVPVGKATYGRPQIYWLFTDYSNINPGLSLGRFCIFEYDIIIWLGGNHCYRRISTYPWHQRSRSLIAGENYRIRQFFDRNDSCPESVARSMIIGHDVHIGHNSALVRGVTVGHGAVIRPYSVVRTDIDPYGIVEGNPAVRVGYRFDWNTRQRLLKIAWWNWPDDVIDDNMHLFHQNIDSLSPDELEAFLVTAEAVTDNTYIVN